MPPDLPASTLRLQVDGAALTANWRALDRLSGSANTGAAVKADGYGLGIDLALPPLIKAGAREFFVAHFSEVPALLDHVAPAQVAVLHGPADAGQAAFAAASGIVPVINSVRQAQLWAEAGGGPCHLMVDTGINRLGLPMGALGDPAIAALEVDVLMSHLASADEDAALNALQLERFRGLAATVPARRRSLANSAGIALGTDYAFDLTRPGLSLYGGIAREELSDVIAPVVSLQAQVLQLRDLSAGDGVGYNTIFTAQRPMRAATVSLGYADGFLRSRGPGGTLLFEGETLPIIGRVSMDLTVVDASAANALKEGDFLDIPFDLPTVSAQCGLSQYELLTGLGRRFLRQAG